MKSRIFDEKLNGFLFRVTTNSEFEHIRSKKSVRNVNFRLWKKFTFNLASLNFLGKFTFKNFGGGGESRKEPKSKS